MLFHDRHEAGRLLAPALNSYQGHENTLVLGLARGGVVVAFEVAKKLSLPLHVVSPRKIGAPDNPELALGSIMENGECVFNHAIIRLLNVSSLYMANEMKKEKSRAQQRLALYRPYAPLPLIKNQTIILVDDGIATGSTMLVAIKAMRQAEAQRIIVAAPVASTEATHLIQEAADEVCCLHIKDDFIGVGLYYHIFNQTEDDEVIQLLKEANQNV